MENKNEDVLVTNLTACYKSIIHDTKEEYCLFNRGMTTAFMDCFADALFTYIKGTVLVARFIKKSKCKSSVVDQKIYSDKDCDFIKEFKDFSENIPDVSTLTDNQKDEYTKKVNEYCEKVNQIKPEIKPVDILTFDNKILVPSEKIDDEFVEALAKQHSIFIRTYYDFLCWGVIGNAQLGLMKVDHNDFIDVIALPVFPDKEEKKEG